MIKRGMMIRKEGMKGGTRTNGVMLDEGESPIEGRKEGVWRRKERRKHEVHEERREREIA